MPDPEMPSQAREDPARTDPFVEPDGLDPTWVHRGARQGFETAWVRRHGAGHRLTGHTSAVEDGVSWAVGYRIDVDGRWHTIRADLTEWVDGGQRSCSVGTDGAGRWTVDGVHAGHLDGCTDIDLESSVLTNTIFLHRVQPTPGELHRAPAAFVRCAPLRVERLDQTYRRTTRPSQPGEVSVEYTAPAFDVDVVLRFGPDGLVRDYPGLATRFS